MSKSGYFIYTFIFSLFFSHSFSQQKNTKETLPGLELKIYTLGDVQLKQVPELEPGQLPNLYKIVPDVFISDYHLQNFTFAPQATFYMTIEGYLEIPETQAYTFSQESTDGSILYIDGKEIINNDGEHNAMEKAVSGIKLEKGKHKIKITYFKNFPFEYKQVILFWYDKKSKKNLHIPPSAFSHDKNADSSTSSGIKKIVPIKDDQVFSGDGTPLAGVHPSYTLTTLNHAKLRPRVGGMDFLKDGRMIVSLWDSLGEVLIVDGVLKGDTNNIKVKRIAMGLAEPLGLKVVGDKIFVLQKQELTQLIDNDGDEIIDEYKTICNAWGATGNFHEFAFGLVYKDGFFYATLAIAINPGGKSAVPQNRSRGKAVKIGMDGSLEYLASGLRTPNGIGIGPDNEIFIADNQGDWLPANKILHLKKGSFYNSFAVESFHGTEVTPPVVWLPIFEIGNSPTTPLALNDGPYKNQMIHGDVTYGGLQRTFVEKIEGEYQGCVFKFSQGFNGGINRICWGPDGALYTGEIGATGNWKQFGKENYGLQKIKYNGKATFEMLAVRAKSNGMEIEFTEPLNAGQGNSPSDYEVSQWGYLPTMEYGGPKIDFENVPVNSIKFSEDRKKVFLELEGLKQGNVVYIHLNKKWTSSANNRLWTTEGWYTLNHIPENDSVMVDRKSSSTVKKTTDTKASKIETKKPLTDEEILIEGPKLIAKSGCLACHNMDQKILGPSFKMVSAKYTNDAATLKKLTEKVTKGGSGVWGVQAMPPQSHVNKDDIVKMVRYILLLPK